jgi:hypothetical protein
MKNAWPIEAKACGGRHFRGDNVDQNFDSYSVEYTFADGTKLLLEGRNMLGCNVEFASYVHGTKRAGVISTSAHHPAKCRIYKGQKITDKSDIVWAFPQPEPNPYDLEWEDLIRAIRKDEPYNEVERGARPASSRRWAAWPPHRSGHYVRRHPQLRARFAPDVDKLVIDGPASGPRRRPLPVPMPGINTTREYA